MAKLGIFDETIKDKRWFDITLYPQGWYDEEFSDDAVGNTYPTVVLNSPADAGSISDSTPQLLFTGIDTESEELEYQIQIDTVNTFDSTGLVNPTGNPSDKSVNITLSGGDLTVNRGAGAGMVRATHSMGAVQKYWEVFVSAGSNHDSFLGIANAACSLSANLGSTADGWSIVLDGGERYNNGFLSFTYGSSFPAANGDMFGFGYDGVLGTLRVWKNERELYPSTGVPGDPLFTGITGTIFPAISEQAQNITLIWNFGATPFRYQRSGYGALYVAPTALLNKKSEIDAGFLNIPSGGDTHPFTSANQIGFTIQVGDTLVDDTYYWRVRAKDTNGSLAYGEWSNTRSFILTAGGSAIKTILGLIKTSVKTFNSLAIASVKSINGLQ